MAHNVQAIIFDCFGVLATDGWLPFKQQYFSHDSKLLDRATELNKQHDSGRLSHEHFASRIAALAGVSTATVLECTQQNAPDVQLLNYIAQELKPHYKIGLLSNASGNYLNRILGPKYVRLFDAIGLSFEMGTTKPEPEAYALVTDELQVAPKNCIMIDDQERHCEGARQVGMQAIRYKNFAQMKAALQPLLAVA